MFFINRKKSKNKTVVCQDGIEGIKDDDGCSYIAEFASEETIFSPGSHRKSIIDRNSALQCSRHLESPAATIITLFDEDKVKDISYSKFSITASNDSRPQAGLKKTTRKSSKYSNNKAESINSDTSHKLSKYRKQSFLSKSLTTGELEGALHRYTDKDDNYSTIRGSPTTMHRKRISNFDSSVKSIHKENTSDKSFRRYAVNQGAFAIGGRTQSYPELPAVEDQKPVHEPIKRQQYVVKSSGSFCGVNAMKPGSSHTIAGSKHSSSRQVSPNQETMQDEAITTWNKKNVSLSYNKKKVTKAHSAKVARDEESITIPPLLPKPRSRPSIRNILSGAESETLSTTVTTFDKKHDGNQKEDITQSVKSRDRKVRSKTMLITSISGNVVANEKTASTDPVEDTRHHILQNLVETEKNYVISLRTMLKDYYQTLKDPSNNIVVNKSLIDAIFYQVPEILLCHDFFLDQLLCRMEAWNTKQRIGDLFLQCFTKALLINAYRNFINNFSRARRALAVAYSSSEGFEKFLEVCAREHKEKLTLQDLMIMPVQRIPRYVLMLKELLKYTPRSHSDYDCLKMAVHELRMLADKMNQVKIEAEKYEKEAEKVRDIEVLIDGYPHLVSPGRRFIRRDNVTQLDRGILRKDRSLLLFSDLLVCVVKRRAGTFKRMSSGETFKYRLLWMSPLHDISINQGPSSAMVGQTRRTITDKCTIRDLEQDLHVMQQVTALSDSLNYGRKDLQNCVQKLTEDLSQKLQLATAQLEKHQIAEQKQNLSAMIFTSLELSVSFRDGSESRYVFTFESPEVKSSWKYDFADLLKKLETNEFDDDRSPKLERVWEYRVGSNNDDIGNWQVFHVATSMVYNNKSGNSTLHKNSAIWLAVSDSTKTEIHLVSIQSDQIIGSRQVNVLDRVTAMACAPFNLDLGSHVEDSSADQHNSNLDRTPTKPVTHAVEMVQPKHGHVNGDSATHESKQSKMRCRLSSTETQRTVQSDKIIVSATEAICNPSENFLEVTYSNSDAVVGDLIKSATLSQSNQDADKKPINQEHSGKHDGIANTRIHRFGSQGSIDYEPLKLSSLSRYCSTQQLPISSHQRIGRDSSTEETDESIKELLTWLGSIEPKNTLWMGFNDGRCNMIENKRKGIALEHNAPITSMLYANNRAFLSLANGNLLVYSLDHISDVKHDAIKVHLFEQAITNTIQAIDSVWCSCANNIKVINIQTLSIEASILIHARKESAVYQMVYYKMGVWVTFTFDSILRLFHAITYESLLVIDTAPDVLSGIGGDGIRHPQDIVVDLQLTSLLAYNDLLWIGTSVGVILNLPVPTITLTTTSLRQCPPITLLGCGHLGCVNILSIIVTTSNYDDTSETGSYGRFDSPTLSRSSIHTREGSITSIPEGVTTVYVISGGRGYRTFKNDTKLSNDGKAINDSNLLFLLFWKVSEYSL